ncbi:hypothetical protein EDD86DRAFT_250231 [Gorgonomyces haynaldii]|nr:hypothetical protein EDD86DRAFT_250231 [Gorgonomyces haynaldii]
MFKLQFLLLLLAVATCIYFAQDLFKLTLPAFEYIQQHLVVGCFIYLGLFTVLCLLLVPATLPTLLGGFLFGFPGGLGLTLFASQLTLLSALLIGKHLHFKRPDIFNRLNLQDPTRIVCLLRLSPLFPFGITNYVLSLCDLPLWSVMLGTFLGNIPGAATYSFLGSMALELNKPVEIDLKYRIAGGLCGLGISVFTGVYTAIAANVALGQSYQPIGDEESNVEGWSISQKRYFYVASLVSVMLLVSALVVALV